MESLDIRRRLGLRISEKLREEAIREHPLQQLFWECTLRCNLHCRHCGSDCKSVSDIKDMPYRDFAKVLDSVAAKTDPHKVFIIFTGGEPLMRPDLEACIADVYRRGFPSGMVTNGYALTPAKLQRLVAAGLHTMTISLDGLEETHDWMRQVKGSFARAEAAIRAAAASRLSAFDVVTCVNQRNYGQLPEIKRFLIDCGVKEWRLFSVFPVGRAAEDPELRLTKEQYTGLMEFIRTCRKEFAKNQEGAIKASFGCEGFLGNYEGDVRDHFFFCQAGVFVGSVMVDGSISACTSIRSDYIQGNIYRDDFMDVWENRFEKYRDHSWMRTGKCAECKVWKHCLGNGMHLRDSGGNLLFCNYEMLR